MGSEAEIEAYKKAHNLIDWTVFRTAGKNLKNLAEK